MIFLSISVVILSAALVVTSRTLSITTKRLNRIEKTLNQVVSVVAMAEPEKFNLLLTAPPKGDNRVDNLATSLECVPDHHRREALEAIVAQNLWLSQAHFNGLLALVPQHHRGEALQSFIRVKADDAESTARSMG